MKTPPLLALSLAAALSIASCSRQPASEAAADKAAAPAVTHLDPPGAAKLLEEDSSVTVLDVRTPEEFVTGHLAGALNIDFRSPEFAEVVARDLRVKQPYLLHCRSGGRSSAALEVLKGLGFEKLYHLDGGISAWDQAGLPVEK